MSNSVSHSELKFLLDENVDIRLKRFLKSKGLNTTLKPKELSNGRLAEFSISEQRVLITNDSDFTDSKLFPKEKVFSVVWLRIPQDKPELLIKSFSKLLKEKTSSEDFKGNLITLEEDSYEVSPIPSSTLT
ncbi:MAG: DUF5615 family PIN-like protein [Nanoarchaeota archaeon]|nr:DUF5615 family PIN-like protein [Nanoarchaeota archaeon]